ncbi:MAG: FAD-linked oxidase C-terminal domain-containing protein [Anaerotruncus colihominis]
MAQICLEQGALDVLISDTEELTNRSGRRAARFWKRSKARRPVWTRWTSLCRAAGWTLWWSIRTGFRPSSVRIKSFGHAGDGNLHAYILRDGLPDGVWEEKLALAWKSCMNAAGSFAGRYPASTASATPSAYLSESAARILALMRAVKRLRPKGILNPHKVCEP